MIYPPTLNSSQDAFNYNRSNYAIYFTLNKITSLSEIGHIQVRIVKQSNNTSIINTGLYPDGTIYKNIGSINSEGTRYYITVLSSDLNSSGWEPGVVYKIQIRFGKNPIYTSISDFADWRKIQIDTNAFSEWSTVMTVKAISEPTVKILNAEGSHVDSIRQTSETTTTPLFIGSCATSIDEPENRYMFELFDEDLNFIESSNWLIHNSNDGQTSDEHRFKTVLENNKKYIVKYTIETKNGFVKSADDYLFLVSENFLNNTLNMIFEAEDNTVYCSENGCINIYLTATNINGSYVITRASEKDNFTKYEDIQFLLFSQRTFNRDMIFQDFTIESGIKYKYAFQMENKAGLRTSPLYEQDKNERSVNFEYAYLYRDGIQLRIMFNQKMSSFKHTVLSSKQDTLGDKYPHLSRNGYAYYAEFPITGTISLQMDKDQTFFIQGEDGYYYKNELVIPLDKYNEDSADSIFNTNLTHNNIFIERKFREKVEEFLNDFNYKLYKSATEGNIIVALQNITLTPNATTGRMIFDFSANAYEVLENTLYNLNEYKIIDIGHFESLVTEDGVLSFGQISGLYTGKYSQVLFNGQRTVVTESSPTQLLNEIRKQEEIIIAEGYKSSIKKINALWVEPYPHINFTNELLALEAERASLANAGKPTDEVDAKIADYETLQEVLDTTPKTKATILEINGKELVMAPNKVYRLNDIQEEIASIKLKYSGPLIINYVCELIRVEDEAQGVISSIDSSNIWGQISGIFTETGQVLKNYNYKYRDSKTYRIYNLLEDKSVIKDQYGNIIVDNTNINLYKTMNLIDIIKQETKKQVELIYDIPNGFTNYNEETDEWDNGTVFYHFNSILMIDIEADPGTILQIGENKREISIGPTGKYTINPSENQVGYISFKYPSFAIINYKCITNQQIMQRGR